MGFSLLLPLLLFILLVQVITAWMAKFLGRSVRFWLLISLLLPLISWVVMLCLPVKAKPIEAVENEGFFDRLFD